MTESAEPPIYGEPPPPPAPRRPRSGTVVAALLGVLALLAGTFFAIQAATDEGGAGDPEEAVRNLFDAIGNEDLIGVMEALVPAERDSLRTGIEDLAEQLERLDVLAPSLRLEKIGGLQLTFSELDFSTRRLGEGVSAVRVENGKARGVVIPRELPLGSFFDFVAEELGEDPRDAEPIDETDEVAEDPEDPLSLVTVERDGNWYVSLWYTVAEAGRADTDLEVPRFGAGLRPDGAASPEEAVEELIEAGASLDLRRVLQLLPPGEASAVHDYAPLFLDDVEEAAAEARQEVEIDISDLKLEAERDGDVAQVELRGFSTEVRTPDERVSVEFDGECATVTGEGAGGVVDDEFCQDDLEEALGGGALPAVAQASGFTTVQVGGEWYLSPTRTVFDALVNVLEGLERKDLEDLVERFDPRASESESHQLESSTGD